MSKEENIAFKVDDGKEIFCPVDYATSSTVKASKAVIIVHGVTGHPFNYALHFAARYFSVRGYDVYRPALYWSGENNRSLSECTTSLHTRDIQSVVDALREEYSKLFVIGHSLAGTSLIGLTHSADGYSFWDSDYVPWDDTWCDARYNDKLDAYFLGWGTECLIGKDMVEEARNTPESKILEQLKAVSVPSQVIAAEFGQASSAEKLFAGLRCRKEFRMLANSGHTFVENDSAERLAKMTSDWFERH